MQLPASAREREAPLLHRIKTPWPLAAKAAGIAQPAATANPLLGRCLPTSPVAAAEVGTGEYLYSIFMPVGCLIVGYGVCLLFMPGIARAADRGDTTARCAWPGGPGEPSQTIGVLQRASMSYPNAPATRRRHRPSDRARSPGRWPAPGCCSIPGRPLSSGREGGLGRHCCVVPSLSSVGA